MPAYTAILFDLDGTLLDSIPLIVESFEHAFVAVGRTPPSRDQILKGVGTPLGAYFARWVDEPDVLGALVAQYRAYNLAHHDRRVSAFPGVVDMVAGVRHAGCRTALVTSKNHATARRGLDVMGLAAAFDLVIGCDDVVRPKPDREPVDRALAQLGQVRPGEALFVGDSLHDLESGHAAGVATAAALWGPFDREHLAAGSPTYWLDTPADLLALLDAER